MSNGRVCFLIERQNASSYTDTLMFLKIFKDCNYKGLIVHGNNKIKYSIEQQNGTEDKSGIELQSGPC